MFKQFFQKRKEAKESAAAIRASLIQTRVNEAKERSKAKQDAAIQEMISKPCPFMSGDKCSSACIHFNTGRHGAFYFGMDGEVYDRFVAPSCKLWQQ